MSTSEKQIEANRQNAQKSTGPKTEEGKKTSSRNATTHGLNSVDIIINSPRFNENQSDYDLLVASLIDDLNPRGAFQQHLAYRIANCFWRYRRAINAETGSINRQLSDHDLLVDHPAVFDTRFKFSDNKDYSAGLINSKQIPNNNFATTLWRYESRVERQLYRAQKLLQQLQALQKLEAKKEQKPQPSPNPVLGFTSSSQFSDDLPEEPSRKY